MVEIIFKDNCVCIQKKKKKEFYEFIFILKITKKNQILWGCVDALIITQCG